MLVSGTGLLLPLSLALTLSSQGRPVFVVLLFVSMFVTPNPLLASSRAKTVAAFSSSSCVLTVLATTPMPVLHQAFVVGLSFSPIPAQIVTQIVPGKFVEFEELLTTNIMLMEPERQLLFDGCLVLTLSPKKSKCHIEDIAEWMSLFNLYVGSVVVLSALLEEPQPIPIADPSDSPQVFQSCVASLQLGISPPCSGYRLGPQV